MNFKNLKIGQKIVSGFLLIALIALIIGVTGIIGMNNMGNSFDKVANVNMSSVYYLGEMNINVESIYKDYVRLEDPSLERVEREQIITGINTKRTKLLDAMNEYDKIKKTEEEAVEYDEIKNLISSWRNVNTNIEKLNARFMEIDIVNPSKVEAEIKGFIKDHYELQLKILNGTFERMSFEGGEDAEICEFGKWLRTFSTRNNSFNSNVREMRQYHEQFHESIHRIKNYINKGAVDQAFNCYQEDLQPSAKGVFSVFNSILDDVNEAQVLLTEINESVIVESGKYYNEFEDKFNRLKEDSRQTARAEREKGSDTFQFSIILIILTILIGLTVAIVLSLFITRNITGGLNNGLVFAEKIAKGDLSVDLDADVLQQKDEVGQLGRALKHMVTQLKTIIGDVVTSADNITAASLEMSSGSQQLSQGASEQASSAEEISSSMEEMTANIQQNTESALQTEKIALMAADGIRKVRENALASTKAMKDIASKVSIIGDIAYKTNILALNAAVEAARAGEHGQGFAVVADEVRKLAEQSQVAADEIDGLSLNSVNMADEAGKQLMDIVPDIEKTAKLVQEIAAASMEQNSGAEQINSAIQGLNTVIQQNAAASEEMASSSEELSSQADQMKEVVSYFVVGKEHHGVSTKKSLKTKKVASGNNLKPEERSVKASVRGIDLDLNDVDANVEGFDRF
ncbi:MAG: MCP four helix bundle domain-containing protein [Bacteroidales bacterium]|nr:MCP four helix bundle domain-containing protein [Bacteroidales bacterium]